MKVISDTRSDMTWRTGDYRRTSSVTSS